MVPYNLTLVYITSDSNERAHFWLPSAADGETKPTVHDMLDSQTTERMYIDAGEIVRVRIESDEFYDHEPGPPPKALEGVRVAREQKRAPYTITVSSKRLSFFCELTRRVLYSVRSRSKGLDLYRGGRMRKSRRWTRIEGGSHPQIMSLTHGLLVSTTWKRCFRVSVNVSNRRRMDVYSGWMIYR